MVECRTLAASRRVSGLIQRFGLFAILLLFVIELRFRLLDDTQTFKGHKHSPSASLRLLFLGDSITRGLSGQGDYPAELESLLSAQNLPCGTVEVINGGLPGAETRDIANQISILLDRHRPDIVFSMIGGADRTAFEESNWRTTIYSFVRQFRIWRFADFHLRNWLQNNRFGREIPNNPIEGGTISGGRSDPEAFEYFYGSGLDSGDYTHRFGAHLRNEKKYEAALKLHQKMLAKYPYHRGAKIEIGYIYLELGNISAAERSFRDAISPGENSGKGNNKFNWAYIALGELFDVAYNNFLESEKFFLAANRATPEWNFPYLFLSNLYLKYRRPELALKTLIAGVENCPEDPRIVANLGMLYGKMGKKDLAERYLLLSEELFAKGRAWTATTRYYSELSTQIVERGIIHVALTYPLMPPEPLERIFAKHPRRYIFGGWPELKNELRKATYADFFLDQFGGIFGHPTKRAAKAIALEILPLAREVVAAACGREISTR